MGGIERLGPFEELVLMALIRLGTNAYGVTIRQELAKRTGKDISVGAAYTTLERLERNGYVSSWMGEPTPERGGRAKRYFRIEAPGEKALRASHEVMRGMLPGVAHA